MEIAASTTVEEDLIVRFIKYTSYCHIASNALLPVTLSASDDSCQHFAVVATYQIRRRQREGFLEANAERGLYFTPHLYDGFMSLLQRAKAAALAAEAGSYDWGSSDDTNATLQPANELPSSDAHLLMGDGTAGSARNEVASSDEKEAMQGSGGSMSVEAGVKGYDNENTNVEVVKEETTRERKEHDAVETACTEATDSESLEMESRGMAKLKSMLQALDSSEWDGSVDAVLGEIEDLNKWIVPPAWESMRRLSSRGWSETEARGDIPGLLEPQANEDGKGGEVNPQSGDDAAEESGNEAGEDEQEGDEEEEQEKEDKEESEEEEMEDESSLVREQKSIRADWHMLELEARLKPELDCSALMREAVGNMVDEVAGAIEEARQQASGMVSGVESLRGPLLGYNEVRRKKLTLYVGRSLLAPVWPSLILLRGTFFTSLS